MNAALLVLPFIFNTHLLVGAQVLGDFLPRNYSTWDSFHGSACTLKLGNVDEGLVAIDSSVVHTDDCVATFFEMFYWDCNASCPSAPLEEPPITIGEFDYDPDLGEYIVIDVNFLHPKNANLRRIRTRMKLDPEVNFGAIKLIGNTGLGTHDDPAFEVDFMWFGEQINILVDEQRGYNWLHFPEYFHVIDKISSRLSSELAFRTIYSTLTGREELDGTKDASCPRMLRVLDMAGGPAGLLVPLAVQKITGLPCIESVITGEGQSVELARENIHENAVTHLATAVDLVRAKDLWGTFDAVFLFSATLTNNTRAILSANGALSNTGSNILFFLSHPRTPIPSNYSVSAHSYFRDFPYELLEFSLPRASAAA